MSQPIWNTPQGSIGSYPAQVAVSIQLSASAVSPATTVTYLLLSGSLPTGLSLSTSGLITGSPGSVSSDTTYTFVVRVTDNTGNIKDRTFSLLISGVSSPTFITPSGEILSTLDSIWVETPILYSNPIATNEVLLRIVEGQLPPGLEINEYGLIRGYANPPIVSGVPTVQTYSFTVKLESPLGTDIETYSITVRNQNAPIAQGGLSLPPNARTPVILNTRPETYEITDNTPYYGYYVFPENSTGNTYAPTQLAYIGKFASDNVFNFKIIGKDFDNNNILYSFADLPLGLTGDATTGWITGTPVIADNTISQFNFSVAVYKTVPSVISSYYNFSIKITNNIEGDVVWITPSDLGTIENSSISTLSVQAESDTSIEYRLVGGSLPPNLTLLSNGEITGIVAYQPTNTLLNEDATTTFNFSVEAFSSLFPVVNSTKTFTLTVVQTYTQPTDTLYIKCTPDVEDRDLIKELLNSEQLIPTEYLYRQDDQNFGKATNVTYVHAYGIFANSVDAYIAAVTKNHYWRNLTLGELKTAVAKNDQGEVIYEVVYSSVIDNLINPEGVSVSKELTWPRNINLNLGPWYTSVTNLYSSYENLYTSLTPGTARTLYPNSLPNMREQVGDVLGQEFNFRLYPLWMISQQSNGSTLGFTPAWVICYTKPGYAEIIKNNIENNWKNYLGDTITLNQINFKIDRFIVDKELTYDYDTSTDAWTGLPSATPVPDPRDSENFFVLFPRETILPDENE